MNALWRRILELFRPAQLDREAVEELSHHVDLLVERNMSAGLEPIEARRQALAEVGTMACARERMAEGRSRVALDQLGREIRYAARVLRRSPGITLLSVTTMGVGIGVSAILFALVNAIVLRPLPYPEADRLVRIFDTNPQAGVERAGVAIGNVDDWRALAGAFDGIVGYYVMGRTVTVGADADVLITAQVSRDFFDVLGVRPELGRPFTEDETRRADFNSALAPVGPDPVVMLSHDIWEQHFGGDPRVIGQTVTVERRPFQVVGVMPKGFAMPEGNVQIWIPWNISGNQPRDQHFITAIARLKPAISLEQAESMLNAVARDLGEQYPATNRGWGVQLSPLAIETIGSAAKTLWILLAAVGLVLLVACANVALLSLMRGLDRREETAVRLALGASSTRLLREFFFESALLALLGGTIGAVIAVAGLRLLPSFTTDLPRLREVSFDLGALLFIAAVTALSAILSGFPQAWRGIRAAPSVGLSSGTLRATEGIERHALRDGIVIAQVAMAVVLMTASGLLVRSYQQLRSTDPGFDPRGVLVGADFSGQSGLRRRREIACLLPDVIRAVVGAPRRRLRRRRDNSPHQPARTGLRATRLARERRSGRLAAIARIRTHSDTRILQDDGNPSCRGPSHRRPRCSRRAASAHGQRGAGPPRVAGSARHRPATGGGLQHGRNLSVRSRRRGRRSPVSRAAQRAGPGDLSAARAGALLDPQRRREGSGRSARARSGNSCGVEESRPAEAGAGSLPPRRSDRCHLRARPADHDYAAAVCRGRYLSRAAEHLRCSVAACARAIARDRHPYGDGCEGADRDRLGGCVRPAVDCGWSALRNGCGTRRQQRP